MEMKYGEKEIREFDINKEENFWPNAHDKNYIIDIELPEFMAKCPRSGYPDFATIKIQYTPNKRVIELWLKVIADFKPRGNVHTIIEIDSAKI